MTSPVWSEELVDQVDGWAFDLVCQWFRHPLMQESHIYDGIDLGEAATYGLLPIILDGLREELARD